MHFVCSGNKYWKEIQESIYKMFMPIPLDKDDWSPCSYLFLFSPENYAASHYSFIWAQVSYGGGQYQVYI